MSDGLYNYRNLLAIFKNIKLYNNYYNKIILPAEKVN